MRQPIDGVAYRGADRHGRRIAGDDGKLIASANLDQFLALDERQIAVAEELNVNAVHERSRSKQRLSIREECVVCSDHVAFAKYLIDQDGVVRYTRFGEGKYAETEEKILELLLETDADLTGKGLDSPSDEATDPAFNRFLDEMTPELYAGYERNYSAVLYGRNPYVLQREFYDSQDAVVNFVAPEELSPSKIYFNGPWLIESERS